MSNYFLIFYTFCSKKIFSYILIYTYEEKRPKINFVDKNISLYQRVLPQISALFEPILNSTPSISALLLLLAEKERCIHGDSTAPSCTYLVHVYRRKFNDDPHLTNLFVHFPHPPP